MPRYLGCGCFRVGRLRADLVEWHVQAILVGTSDIHIAFQCFAHIFKVTVQFPSCWLHPGQSIESGEDQRISLFGRIGDCRSSDESAKVFFWQDKVGNIGFNVVGRVDVSYLEFIATNIHVSFG